MRPLRSFRTALAGWMLLACAVVLALAYWDEQREAQSALDDFAEEQALLAQALSRALAEGLAKGDPAAVPRDKLLSPLKSLDRAGVLRVLVRPPGQSRWFAALDGSSIDAAPLTAAALRGDRSARLSRAEAAEVGLPARTAMAGLAKVDERELGPWAIAVVATAQAERDRERRAVWRLVLGVTLTSVIVLAFGGLADRKQRRELELKHALELAEVRSSRNERLIAADKLATMGALATGIAHEVSTPLGVIVTRADQILGKADLDERTLRAARAIAAQADRINEVIRGFLALARGHSPRLEDHDPATLAKSAIDLVEHRFEKAGVSLASRIATDLPTVACEARLFEQVLANLLLNACEACDRGGSVEVGVHDAPDGVIFEVTDDGTGIRPEDAARVKEPFFTTKAEGSGLGLAIANEIVHHHYGSLALEPRAGGRGTHAVVTLPTRGARG
jgi:signal transduction histidine kinase